MNEANEVEAVKAMPAEAGLLALIEVLDRGGAIVQRLPVRRWPVTVGRALTNDLVLADAHVAAEHLRIEAPASSGHAPLTVRVLDTVNGARHGHHRHARDSHFDWTGQDELSLGRLRLRVLLAGAALAPEQLLVRFRWRPVAATLALVLVFAALAAWQSWLGQTETNKFVAGAAKALGVLFGVALLWTGLAALLTKLFTPHAQFWRHLRIVLGVGVASALLEGLASTLAFAFDWVPLARFGAQLDWWALATGLLLQWWVIAPPRRKRLQATVIGLLAMLALGGMAWTASRDNQSGPRLANLDPPGWRLVAPVPVAQWMKESQALRQRLDERLQQDDEDRATDAGEDDSGED